MVKAIILILSLKGYLSVTGYKQGFIQSLSPAIEKGFATWQAFFKALVFWIVTNLLQITLKTMLLPLPGKITVRIGDISVYHGFGIFILFFCIEEMFGLLAFVQPLFQNLCKILFFSTMFKNVV